MQKKHLSYFLLVAGSLLLAAGMFACTTTHKKTTQAQGERCTFSAQLKPVEALPMEQRLRPALVAMSLACPETLGDLAQAAAKAAGIEDRSQRAQVLAAAASLALPSGCSASNPLAAASSLQWGCPAPQEMQLAEALLKDLDAGTYLFVLASRARLQGSGKLDKDAGALLKNLMLSAAIEAEVARETAADKVSQ